MPEERRMHDLIAKLDDEDTGLAELAEAELRDDYGPLVVGPLLEAMPEFGSFGILSAVELLGEFGDERAGPTLIALLGSEEHVVREWTAGALGELRINDAIDPLKLAYERVKARRTPLHWAEPNTIRNALTSLGAREEIIPASVARLRLQRMGPNPRHYWERSWQREHVAEVIDALADAGQAIVTVIAWAAGGGAHISLPEWEPDWSLPWSALVEQTRRDAKASVMAPDVPHDAVVMLDWMNENDI
jgi:hypothetical protein